jgi:Holliday junction resolvase
LTSPSKRKGSRWERDVADLLSKYAESSKRIPGSGALGTTLVDTRLTGDVTVKYPFFSKSFKGEAKYGYGGSTQMTVKREWMEKIRKEAHDHGSIPFVTIKFKNVTGGDIESGKWICFSIEDWNELMRELTYLFEDFEEFWSWKYNEKE